MSQAISCASAAHLGPLDRIARQQRRLRVNLVEILDDRERLDEHVAGIELQRRHAHLRIDRAEVRLPVEAALLLQMDRDHVAGEPLEVERDANPKGRRRAKVGVELHVSSLRSDALWMPDAPHGAPISNLAAFAFGDQLGRAFGQLLHGAVEGGTVGGCDHLGKPIHELERARGELLVDRAAGRRQRQEGFSKIGAICAPGTGICAARVAPRPATLWSCACGSAAPTALPVITPFSPSVTSTRHSGIPIP